MERRFKIILYDDVIYPVFLDQCIVKSHFVLFRMRCQRTNFLNACHHVSFLIKQNLFFNGSVEFLF